MWRQSIHVENDDWLAHVSSCKLYGYRDLIGKFMLKGESCGSQVKLLDIASTAEVSLLLLVVVVGCACCCCNNIAGGAFPLPPATCWPRDKM